MSRRTAARSRKLLVLLPFAIVAASCNGILGLEEGQVIGTGGGQGSAGSTDASSSSGNGACVTGDGSACTALPEDCGVVQPVGNIVRNYSFEPPGREALADWTASDALETMTDFQCNADRSLNFLSTSGTVTQSLVLPPDLGDTIPACSCITASLWRFDRAGDGGHQLRIGDDAHTYELFATDPLGDGDDWVQTVQHCRVDAALESPTLELFLNTANDYVDMLYVKVDPASCCTKPCLELGG